MEITLLFLAGVGRAVPIRVMYGGKGNGLWPPRCYVFGTGGQQSAGSILKRRDSEKKRKKRKKKKKKDMEIKSKSPPLKRVQRNKTQKKPHSKLTVNDEILKTHLLRLKTRQKHWLLNTSRSPSQHEKPKQREESSLLQNVENPEHMYKLEEQVTES